MSTEAQSTANKANAQHSTGPTTPEGKAASSRNNHRHGFTGQFSILPSEDPYRYQSVLSALMSEHKADTFTETVLVERMAQHLWLRDRALLLQHLWFENDSKEARRESSFALYIRYQTTNERAFSKCLSDLLKLRAEKRKEQIGFESQQLAQQDLARKQSIENRKQDLHKMDVWLAEAKAEHQELLNHNLETPEMRNPGRVQRIQARTQAA